MLAVHRTKNKNKLDQRRTTEPTHTHSQKPRIEHYVSFIIVSRTAAKKNMPMTKKK